MLVERTPLDHQYIALDTVALRYLAGGCSDAGRYGWGTGVTLTLSLALRRQTAAAHLQVEDVFALPTRLSSRDSYAALLHALRAFYVPLEAALTALVGWDQLTPRIDLTSRRRAAQLDDDLRDLGAGASGWRETGQPAVPQLRTLSDGLGCLYVLEGSALGGQIVARQARAALGSDLPVAFFASANRDQLGADWKALQRALDGHGQTHDPEDVISAAEATFTAMGSWLDHCTRLAPAQLPVLSKR